MFRKIAAVLASLVMGVALASPASAAPAEAQNHLIGSTYLEWTGTEVLTFTQIDAVTASAPITAKFLDQCPGKPYLCRWDTSYFEGTFWKYDMNTVRAKTTNGVAHCWNIYSGDRNKGNSWQNESDWYAGIYDNINCNYAVGGGFGIPHRGETAQCVSVAYTAWCNRDSSVKAS